MLRHITNVEQDIYKCVLNLLFSKCECQLVISNLILCMNREGNLYYHIRGYSLLFASLCFDVFCSTAIRVKLLTNLVFFKCFFLHADEEACKQMMYPCFETHCRSHLQAKTRSPKELMSLKHFHKNLIIFLCSM